MSKEIKWAVLGTGVIANEMAAGLQKMGKSLYAVGNRTYDKAVAFAEKYGIEKSIRQSMKCLPMKMWILST
jgi:predicted dehydrogenase